MNYKLIQNPVNSNGRVTGSIREVKTDIMIADNIPMIEAQDLCRSLNRGGGFNGWTPEFLMKDFPLYKENNF